MKNIKYFVGAVCLALSLNSCSDFLNEEPVSEIPAGDMWQTARDAKAGINEIYGLLRSTLRENYFYWGEFRSDNVAPGAPVMADQARVINNLMSTDEKCAKWTTLYQMINQTNLAIKYVPNISMPDVADRNDYLGQAYALRALAYFDLVRVYAQPYGYIKEKGLTGVEAMGVPIVLKDDLSARPSRNTVAEVYENLIIPDLVEAERLMSDSYVRAGVKDVVATVTKPVIQALMARVYLHHEDWQLAADYATKVIKNGRFRLLSGDRFVSMWDGSVDVAPQSGSEIIFEVYVSQSDGSRSDLGDYLTAPEVAGGAGYGDVRVSNDLINLYDATDVRLTGLTKTNSKYSGYRWSTKYPGKNGQLAYNNVPVLRISEMYLIRSEAIYRGATVSGVTAIDDLNRVATNRNAEAYASVTLDNLFEESRKEFLFEGHIFFDMKRLQKSLVRTDYDLDPLTKNIDFPSYRWALPIPENDILYNDNMDQNPGYQSK